MQRALILLNPCGREAGQRKLKNGLKTQKRHFLAVLDLMSDNLTTILVEPNQCPSNQSILLTQEPIHEILVEIARLLAMLKNSFFFFFEKNFKMAAPKNSDFQNPQFSKIFCENFMDRSLG